MVSFTMDEIRQLMEYPDNIRNMSVIAQVDHGKSTLTDSLIQAAGMIGEIRFTCMPRSEEQPRTTTIVVKSTVVPLIFEIDNKDMSHATLKQMEEQKAANVSWEGICKRQESSPFLINLIDSPGHVKFSSEVTAALRVTDGALIIIDCVEGVGMRVETVLRQAIAERIKPVLFVNKLDRIFLELCMDHEEAYQTFFRTIESVNVVISTYKDELLGDVQVHPEDGTVCFGSGLHGWGFTIQKFGEMYATKFGVSRDKMTKKLWGDNYFSGKEKKWGTKPIASDGSQLDRGFCGFILKPISYLVDAVMNDKKQVYEALLEKLHVKISKEFSDAIGKPLLKAIMREWLPAPKALMTMIVNHLPSPAVAQRYRVENLYGGSMDDECALAIKNCDKKGPLMMYVSKMVPTSEKGRFYAFGRVFSGVVATGQPVRIMGTDYQPGKKTDLYCKTIERTVLMRGRFVEHLHDVPCGNICGLVGIDGYLLNSGTVSTHEKAHKFHTMNYSTPPVVHVEVECVNPSDLPDLVEGLKRLAKSYPLVQCYTAQTGELIVAGANGVDLEVCLTDLRNDLVRGAPLKVGQPVTAFCETVTKATELEVMSKSPNKHNRIYMTAEPLGDKFCEGVGKGDIKGSCDIEIRSRLLAESYGWDVEDARRIWSFGCPPVGLANVLVDATKGTQYLSEVKDPMVRAFMHTTTAGVICEEAMRGIRYNLLDIRIQVDSIHRGPGQIIPPTKRAMYACQIKSGPSLMEPVYMVDITVPREAIAGVYATLGAHRGVVEEKTDLLGSCKFRALLPVMESFAFTRVLPLNTGHALPPEMTFSHWQHLNGDVYDEKSQAHDIALTIRKRKGLKDELPKFEDYYDTL